MKLEHYKENSDIYLYVYVYLRIYLPTKLFINLTIYQYLHPSTYLFISARRRIPSKSGMKKY